MSCTDNTCSGNDVGLLDDISSELNTQVGGGGTGYRFNFDRVGGLSEIDTYSAGNEQVPVGVSAENSVEVEVAANAADNNQVLENASVEQSGNVDVAAVENSGDNQTGGGYVPDLSEPLAGNPVWNGVQRGNEGCSMDINSGSLCTKAENNVPVQTGGARVGLYQKITNPKSGRTVNLFGKTGQKIYKRYLKNFQRGGSLEFTGPDGVFADNMGEREFGCNQPDWDPKCI